MKKAVRILLAILMVASLTLGFAACKSECEKGNHDKYVVSTDEATCTTGKVEHWACHNCDWTEDVTGDPLGHDFGKWTPCTDNDAQHQRACKRGGCTVVEKADHAYVNGVCVCGKTEGIAPQPCTHPDKTSTETPATCTAAKVIHWTCPDCDWTDDETVGEPLGHDYEGAEWHANGSTHYQVCKRDGCDHHSEGHQAVISAYELKDGVHEHHCTVEGCTISESHSAQFSGNWTPSETDGKHERTCGHDGCSIKELADHDFATKDIAKSVAPKCEEGGSDYMLCVCGAHKVVPVGELGHLFQTDNWTTGGGYHWHECKRDGCNATTEKVAHTYDSNEALRCNVCHNPREGVNFVLSYGPKGNLTELAFDFLYKAVAYATNDIPVGTPVLIEMGTIDGKEVRESTGIKIGLDKDGNAVTGLDLTINFKGKTYQIARDPVGSKGTETNGFQILKGNKVKLMNGTISVKAGIPDKVYNLIQNYSNLTLNNINIDGTNLTVPTGNFYSYALSNNCGKVVLENAVHVTAATEKGVAMDAWYNLGGNYPQGVQITVGPNSTIKGVIEYGSAQANVADLASKLTINLPELSGVVYNIRFSGNANCENAGIKIGGKAIAHVWDEGEQTKAPSCSAEGEKTFHCTVAGCNCTKNEAIGKLAHTEEVIEAVAPSCTETGLTAGVKCSVCDAIITAQQVVPATGHTVTDGEYVGGHKHEGACSVCGETVEVDCTIENDACTICGRKIYNSEEKTVTIDTSKQGYRNEQEVTEIKSGDVTVSLDKKTNSNSPKYYDTGKAVRLYAGGVMTVSLPEGSTITKITFTFDSKDDKNTVTANVGSFNGTVWTGSANSVEFKIGGTKGSRRFQTITVEFTAKTCNHFYGDWSVTTAESCTTDGEKSRTCLDCNHVDTEVIKAHHTLGELVSKQEPSCAGEGTNGHVAYYQCSVCRKYFEDEQATEEIANIVIEWQHNFEVVPEVPATADHSGKQSYNHCNVCGRNYELDGTTEITDLENWGIINFNCEHTTHVWKLVEGRHVCVCAACGKDEQGRHSPEAGTWSGTDVHVQSCGVEGCTLNYAQHNADYSEAYTEATEDGKTYHVQACQGENCTLVTATKHEAALGNPVATEDKSQHYYACTADGCNFTTDPVNHSANNYEYIPNSNGKHSGTCACGEVITGDCDSNGANNSCSVCGRIVGSIVNTDSIVFDGSELAEKLSDTNGLSKSDITIVFAKNSGSTSPTNPKDTSVIRLYPKNTVTISVSNDFEIVGIVFKDGVNNANSKGTYLTGLNVNIGAITDWQNWNAPSESNKLSSLIFTPEGSAGNFQFSAIEVTVQQAMSCHHDGTLEKCNETPKTCTTNGYRQDCWHCTNCDMYFTSEACTDIAVDVVIEAGHDYGELIKERPATCQQEQYFFDHYVCSMCRNYFNSSFVEGDRSTFVGTTVDHVWSDWVHDEALNSDGNHTHSRTCEFDTAKDHVETEPCTLSWAYDADSHWKKCSVCGYEDSDTLDVHVDENGDGICDVCTYNQKEREIAVTVEGADDNVVTVSISKANIGEETTFTVTVGENYRLISVTDLETMNVITPDENGAYKYTFTSDSVDSQSQKINLYVEVVKQVTVKLSSVENGSMTVTYVNGTDTVTVSDGDKVDVGTTLTIAVTPADDTYEVKAINVTGEASSLPIIDNKATYKTSEGVSANEITISAEIGLKRQGPSEFVLITNSNKNLLVDGAKILIVNKASKNCFNGSLDSSKLAASKNFKSVSFNANSNIDYDETLETYAFSLEIDNNDLYIKSSSGYYIGRSETSNGFESNQTRSADLVNTITVDASGNTTITGKGGVKLQYFSQSGSEQFKYYKSSQQAINIYVMV